MATCLHKVTHLLLPALITEWHRENATLIQQPEYTDLLNEWEILVHKVDNTSKGGYFNFIIKLIPQFQHFANIKFQPKGIYLSLVTRRKYKQLLQDFTKQHANIHLEDLEDLNKDANATVLEPASVHKPAQMPTEPARELSSITVKHTELLLVD